VALSCPTQSEILQFIMADAPGPDARIAEHLSDCASCRGLVAELREVVRELESTAELATAASEACLDEVALADAATGSFDDGRRNTDIAHLAACAHCRRRVADLSMLLADPTIAAEVKRAEAAPVPVRRRHVPRRRFLAAAGMLAAAAVTIVVGRPRGTPDDAREHRGPTITAAAAPLQLSPVGDVSGVGAFRWRAVAGTDRYRVTLFEATGRVLFEAQVTDTVVALPDSIVLLPGRSYLWKVEARTSWERWTPSDLTEFQVRPEPVSLVAPASPPSPFTLASLVAPTGPRDSLHLLASRLSDSALTAEARARPLELREALTLTLARVVHSDPAARAEGLLTARRLAAAYAAAWHDEFLVREVARFAAWPPGRRAAKVWGDSVRRAGITAFGREGAAAAIVAWRRALSRLATIADTAGMAATLGNIGAGLARDGLPDSAERYLARSRALAIAVGDLRVEANATSELAGLSETRGDVAGARAGYAAAIALRERIGDTRGRASDYNNLAGLARSSGDLPAARAHLEAALAINRRDGRREAAATNLVNLAGVAALEGDLRRAAALYGEALAIWRAAGQWADVADALRGLGDLELRRGDYRAARANLRAALAIYDRTGPLTDALEVRRSLAGTSAAEGDLQGALDELRRSQRLADSGRVAPAVRAGIALARADLAAQLNLRPQADRFYASAQRLSREAGDQAGEAAALHGRGMLLLDEENTAGAERMLGAALRSQLAAGDRRSAAITRVSLSAVSLQRGDTGAARRQLARAAKELERLGDPVAAAAALGERAALEAAAGYPAAAESFFRAALAKVGGRTAPAVTWWLHAGLGAVRSTRGAPDDAARELRAAITDIERGGRSLELPERRSTFLADKWDVYVQLALLENARGRAGPAFEVSERLRASEMLGLLARGRVAAPSDAGAELVAREQDLRHRIAELTRQLESEAGANPSIRGPDVARAGEVTREALLRSQESYAELLLEVRERAPRHAALVSPETKTWRDVARRLAPDEAFVEYLLSDAGSLAFVVTRDTLLTVPLGADRRELARLIDFVRGTLQPRGSPRLDSLWRAPLRTLHADLIAPIEASGALRGRTRLTVVPHAELHYLPFAALVSGVAPGRFLVERYQLSIAPSASVWLALGARAPARATAGTIVFGPRPDVLPASRHEVAAIARLGGAETRTLVGSAATEAAFRREAPTRRVIHLTTYGVLNKQNPLFSFVELARGRDDDGRLEAHEVFGLRLAAQLVVLSACQTGLAAGAVTDVPAGDDWVGLTRAFLSAGAERVMGSLWPVQDRATALLMERFYEGYAADADPARALAAAQRALLASPAPASPYYWAGFEVVGGR